MVSVPCREDTFLLWDAITVRGLGDVDHLHRCRPTVEGPEQAKGLWRRAAGYTDTFPIAAAPSETLSGQTCTVQGHLEDGQQPDGSRGHSA